MNQKDEFTLHRFAECKAFKHLHQPNNDLSADELTEVKLAVRILCRRQEEMLPPTGILFIV